MDFSPLIFVHSGCSAGDWASGFRTTGPHTTREVPLPHDKDVAQGSVTAQALDEGKPGLSAYFSRGAMGAMVEEVPGASLVWMGETTTSMSVRLLSSFWMLIRMVATLWSRTNEMEVRRARTMAVSAQPIFGISVR
jgi:hypothetical protein